jgi:hypothetical protein
LEGPPYEDRYEFKFFLRGRGCCDGSPLRGPTGKTTVPYDEDRVRFPCRVRLEPGAYGTLWPEYVLRVARDWERSIDPSRVDGGLEWELDWAEYGDRPLDFKFLCRTYPEEADEPVDV